MLRLLIPTGSGYTWVEHAPPAPFPDEFLWADLFEPTPDEELLIKLHGLTPAQLVWRRDRLTLMGGDLVRFRREYPLTPLEPFLFSGTGWFD